MKLLKEIMIVFGFYYIGEILKVILHIALPGNLIGMLLLFLCLCLKVVKLEQISMLSNYLLQNLSFFFIPAGVGILSSYMYVQKVAIEFIVVCIVSTCIVMITSGLVVQVYFNHKEGKICKK